MVGFFREGEDKGVDESVKRIGETFEFKRLFVNSNVWEVMRGRKRTDRGGVGGRGGLVR